jgi:nicotinamide-nucleotide amidase
LQAEIVAIGTELLLGHIIDTNSSWIAQHLTTIGLNLYYTTTVGDNEARIVEVLRNALKRSDVVITTGGLGPTVDDKTRESVAAATDRDLVLDEQLVEEIATFFGRRGYTMTTNNRKQACLPRGARVIHNPVGTAPCFAVEQDGHVMISLPGVPHEMQYLMEHEVLPYLRERFQLRGVIKSRTLRTCNIGESMVGSRIEDLMQLSNPTVGTAAHPGQTDVRITAKGDSEAEADALIAPVEQQLRERLGEYIFGVDEETISDALNAILAERRLRLSLVETSTRGELAQWLTTAAKGDAAFAGGVVISDASSLGQILDVPSALAEKHGFPSQEIADAAAQGVRRVHGADLGLAIIGPRDPGAPDAPPVYYALAMPDGLVRGQPRKGRGGAVGRAWLMYMGLDLVRRRLLSLPLE